MANDIIKGLSRTLREMGRKPNTISYPEQRRPQPARYRGRHVLHRYDNGLERCVGCFLCAGACPADAIYIEAEENTDEQRVSPGERYARVFDVNMLRCIFCGYCQQACPTGAITLEKEYEMASFRPEDLIYHKEQLLESVGTTHPGENPATIGSNRAWESQPPTTPPLPIPQARGSFDGSQASAAAVGQANLETEANASD